MAELARLLRRSEQSLLRDIRLGRLKVRGGRPAREMSGGSPGAQQISLDEVEKYLGPDETRVLLGEKAKTVPVRVEPEPKTEAAKHCRTCGRLLPAGAFSPDPRSPDGLNFDCRECVLKRPRKRR